MARKFSGEGHVEAARKLRDSAKTARELSQAMAVLLPLECGMSLEQTADVLGYSKGATCRLRTSFFAQQEGHQKKVRYAKLTPARREREAKILDEILTEAAQGGVVVVPPLKPLVEARLGKKICLATMYNMLQRHGWRKLAPDTGHPEGNMEVQVAWKKNSKTTSSILRKVLL